MYPAGAVRCGAVRCDAANWHGDHGRHIRVVIAINTLHAHPVTPRALSTLCTPVSTAKMLSITAGFYGMDRFYYGYIWIGLAKLLAGFFAVMFPICHCCVLGRRYMPTFDHRSNYEGKGFCGKIIAPMRDLNGRKEWAGDSFYAVRSFNKLWCSCTILMYIGWLVYDYIAISNFSLLPRGRPECLLTGS